jgi:hypothetical protein
VHEIGLYYPKTWRSPTFAHVKQGTDKLITKKDFEEGKPPLAPLCLEGRVAARKGGSSPRIHGSNVVRGRAQVSR